jgi:hypothetical protein
MIVCLGSMAWLGCNMRWNSELGRVLVYRYMSVIEQNGMALEVTVRVPDDGLSKESDVAFEVGSTGNRYLVSKLTRDEVASFATLEATGKHEDGGTGYVYGFSGGVFRFGDDRLWSARFRSGDVRIAKSADGPFMTLPAKTSDVIKQFGEPVRIVKRYRKPI